MAITSDILSGATTGASIGAMTGNPIAIGVGAVIGGVSGAITGVQNKKKRDRANKLSEQIAETSTAKPELLAEVRQAKKRAEAGTTRAATRAARLAKSSESTIAANTVKASGGSAGSVISGLLRSRQVTSNAGAAGADVASRLSDRLLGYEQGMVSDMDDRKLWVQTYKRDSAMAEAGMAEQTSQNNWSATLGLATELAAGKMKGGDDGKSSTENRS